MIGDELVCRRRSATANTDRKPRDRVFCPRAGRLRSLTSLEHPPDSGSHAMGTLGGTLRWLRSGDGERPGAIEDCLRSGEGRGPAGNGEVPEQRTGLHREAAPTGSIRADAHRLRGHKIDSEGPQVDGAVVTTVPAVYPSRYAPSVAAAPTEYWYIRFSCLPAR